MAVRAAQAAGLENAATAEFLFDAARRFWFLEVNTRLQVEHGVTELVSDVDIVREQLFLAAGRPLSDRIRGAADRAASPDRHAMEVRLSAEDPARDFAPAPGRIGRWEMPAGPGVRVDTAVEAGERVPPDYDPLIAKILVVDADRPAAIDRLARALDETVVTGIQTTLPFHRWVVADQGFRHGGLPIDWVDQHWSEALVPGRAAALEAARWAAADHVVVSGRGGPPGLAPRSVDPGMSLSPEWARAGRAAAVDRWPR
jgi:acetyl-CoA carboxylase biotin carboxylase subunit